ncbi:MAG: pentapeptide repeat-containing protein [Deltaproteobacteria bacterium]|nr:pentapeptide repeat-containing protein [Deltaproteobacteria bacterium]
MGNGDRGLRVILHKIHSRKSLAGADFRNLYLSCMDLSGLDLRHANFAGCRLNYGVMDRSDLTNANLANSNLTKTSFKHADLTGTVFTDAIVSGANFTGAKVGPETKEYLKSKGAVGLE